MEKSSSAIVVSEPETKKITKGEMYRPWSELTYPIVEMIYGGLEFLDKCQMVSVCNSWRNVAPEFARRCLQQVVPWLLISYDAQSREAFGLLNLHDNLIHQTRIPQINMKLCLGSSQGWLFMFEDARDQPFFRTCFLLNPFTKSRIQLPSFRIAEPPNAVHKVMLSSDPRISQDWTVIGLASRGLIFYKPGFRSWSIGLPRTRNWYPCDDRDIIFLDGKVYALGMLHSLWVFDMETQKYSLKSSGVSPNYDLNRDNDTIDDGYISYLVESNGEIFLVSRFLENIRKPCTASNISLTSECFECQTASIHYVTLNFLLYKLIKNDNRRKRTKYIWARQPSLGADQVLFLSKSGSKSVSTIENPMLHGNSIYFVNDLHPGNGKPCDIGIYHFQDGQFEPLAQIESYPLEFPLVWITPSL
ncbi:putative F-box protein At4g22180 [Macadamia integrifolia]|uniref:putative F-box protein At4g22180 n=1 Tax=Macadamia integrifolia TaxID=60698 RepID=UPI001C52D3A3|nr:putative F-box protein At4g22180 [Macadamia integrifolia]